MPQGFKIKYYWLFMDIVEAIYKRGVLKPKKTLKLKDNTKVVLTIEEKKGEETSVLETDLKKLSFFGMWEDREEISDSINFINILRNEQERRF